MYFSWVVFVFGQGHKSNRSTERFAGGHVEVTTFGINRAAQLVGHDVTQDHRLGGGGQREVLGNQIEVGGRARVEDERHAHIPENDPAQRFGFELGRLLANEVYLDI